MEIWTGGQTGVDRAALDGALELGIPHGGWIPLGRRAEDGLIPPHYGGLRETATQDYADRTAQNVRDTDATLVLCWGPATGGTLCTLQAAERLGRPLLLVDLASGTPAQAAQQITEWFTGLSPLNRVNIAGPRASEAPGAYVRVREVLRLVFRT